MSTRKPNVKEQLSTDKSPAERERVQRQQDYAKQKLEEVKQIDVTKAVKELPSKELPSNQQIVEALHHGQESLEKVKQSEKGQHLPPQGERVVEDLQRVLSDQEVLIQSKNEGDILQKIVRDFWALLQELRQRNDLRVFFEEWQGTLTSVFSSGDFTQFFQQVNELFTSISDTEEFLALVSEIIDLTKTVIAESTEKAVSGGEGSAECRSLREEETRRVSKELRRTLGAMAENDIWKSLVEKSKRKTNQVQEVREQAGTQSTEEVFYRIKDLPQFQQLIDDFKLLLQRFVGSKMSVDPLFDFSKKAFDTIINDEELACIVDDMQRLLPPIAENPALLQQKPVQDELDLLSKRADNLVHRFRNDPNIEGARRESQRLVEVIKSSASGNKLLEDLKILWRDISSDKEGEAIDPDVLKSLRQLIVPFLIEHLNNVPLPAVHDEASFLGKYLYTLDNMKISLPELIPENIHLRFEYEMDAKPLELEVQNQHTYLFLQASNLKLHLHDCHFTYDRITVPKHSDSGVFDVDTKGEGLTIRMKMEIKSDPNKGQYLDILRTDTRIGRFEISFRDSKHDQLYEMMTHLFQSRIKRAILDLIKSRLVDFGTYFNDQIIAIVNQAKKSSHDIAKFAREKTEQAKRGAEQLKTKTQEGIQKSGVQESKEEAVSSGKKILVKASEKAQEELDKVKCQVDEERAKKEASRPPSTNAAEILNITPIDTTPELCPSCTEKPPTDPAAFGLPPHTAP